ncbi:MAG TPA: GH116 family glycosyl hydrolase, partial [Rubricoccaceae bacterium]|nr:GH116 family glycosyl hydrolase [Rubricoccaceae bacterium]
MDGYAFPGQNVETVVGNGRVIARVRAGSAAFFAHGAVHRFRLFADGAPLDDRLLDTLARPGCSVYIAPGVGTVTHAAQPDAELYLVVIEGTDEAPPTGWTLEVEADGLRAEGGVLVTGTGRVAAVDVEAMASVEGGRGVLAVTLAPGGRAAFLLGAPEAVGGLDDPFEAPARWEGSYRARGLCLRTPDPALNRAVDFLKVHMQLGYAWEPEGNPGGKMVCDIFRWRDVWSRDFGSGFGPGALAAGLHQAVEKTLDYEVARYTSHVPAGLKVSDDTSQGGSAESLGWLMKLAWLVFEHTGDRRFLQRMLDAFGPWMAEWIARDADEDGLVVDVTEWMDHSRFLRLPEGQRTLYSNALYYAALRRFQWAHEALGREAEATRYAALAARTRKALRGAFWNENGYFNNAVAWGVTDTALMLADNVIVLHEDLASERERFRVLQSIRERCWRAFGSATCDVPMKYVPLENDHNGKVWPWWMAHEAKARFRSGDAEGGMHVLQKILDTLERPTLPGLCEEYLDPDDGTQDDVAGHAFITGSGATLDAVLYGLVGLSVRAPGERALRLAPQVPRAWTDWEADVELYEGRLKFTQSPSGYHLALDGTHVETLEVRIPPNQTLARATLDGEAVEPARQEEGMEEFVTFRLTPGTRHHINVEVAHGGVQASASALPPPLVAARPALMDEPRLFADVLQGFVVNAVQYFGRLRHLAACEIPSLTEEDDPEEALLVVVGNEMPYRTKRGAPVPPMLDAHLAAGGSLLLLGPRFGRIDLRADFHADGQMGGKAGLFWWKVWKAGQWVDYDPRAEEVTEAPAQHGAVYWGEGPLFRAWEHRHGLFGFEGEFRGVYDAAGEALDAD